ncbi:D-alanyl-D-alanine carboxypeptidase family protein [Caproicibacterium sp. XB2]|nr:D-alanyl-D-alanine carboxypeptidase family protein [Caproicibacterium lactatifermentans]
MFCFIKGGEGIRYIKKDGKKWAAFFLALCIFCGTAVVCSAKTADAVPVVSAQSAILVNADDGSVLWAKNAAQKRPMASTTKIMTALLTLETAACKDRVVDITADMVRVEGSSMGLRAGDRLSLSGLAAGMLSTSGNDAATAAAYALAGSPAAFVQKMNQRAQELKMTNTHFATPSGLDDSQHYSTAEDMAKLACAAMKNASFAAITAQKTIQVHFVQPDCTQTFTNHNKLLSMYNGCIGVKTGFTKKAGRCFVSCAQRNGVRLVAVTLSAPDDWKDHQIMLDYGFSQLRSVPIDDSAYSVSLPLVGGSKEAVQVHGMAGSTVVIPKDANLNRSVQLPHFLYAPLDKEEPVGTVQYCYGGKVVAQTVLTAQKESAAPPQESSVWQKICSFFSSLAESLFAS